jgi:hypothetical protein
MDQLSDARYQELLAEILSLEEDPLPEGCIPCAARGTTIESRREEAAIASFTGSHNACAWFS